MDKILITGASGFVGKYLAMTFLSSGHPVIGLGRSQYHPFSDEFENFEWISADTTLEGDWQGKVNEAQVIINLAGKSIFGYWTEKYKQEIYDSRVLTTRHIVNAMDGRMDRLLISASAVGIYGDAGDQLLTEDSSHGNDFLADVCKDWEKEAMHAAQNKTRVCIFRFGVVLGKDGGALEKMAPAFKSFLGGPLGNGKQWFPWIHIEDIRRAVRFVLENKDVEGVFNVVGPSLLQQKVFAARLGKALGRPSFMPAPAFVVKTVMGEMGKSLLQSQKASPKHLLDSGFAFVYEKVEDALNDILKL